MTQGSAFAACVLNHKTTSSSSMKAYSRLTDNYALVHLRLDEIKGPNAGAAQDVGSIVDIVTDANWQAQIVQARQVFVSHAVDSIVRLMKEPEAVIKLTDAEKAAIAVSELFIG